MIGQLKRISGEVQVLEELVQTLKGEMSGHLKIGIIPTVAPYILPQFLNDFVKKFPKITFSISEMVTANITEMLQKRELDIGILRVERRDTAQGQRLRAWFERRVVPEFADRTLSIDARVARRCARLHVPDPRAERDALIAATALVHGLIVVTRNLSDFASLGVDLLNPWLDPA